MSPAHRNKPQPINAGEAARETLLAVLEAVVCRYHWRGHALCVMDHHDHLVLETPEGNLWHGMWQLNGVYTQQCNRRHACVSHLFPGRYQAIMVEHERSLWELCRDVGLNPVRAGMVPAPA